MLLWLSSHVCSCWWPTGWPTGHLVFRWKKEVGRKGCLEEEECEATVAVFQSYACVWRFVRWSAPQTLLSQTKHPATGACQCVFRADDNVPSNCDYHNSGDAFVKFLCLLHPVGFHQFIFISMKPHNGLTVYKDRQKKKKKVEVGVRSLSLTHLLYFSIHHTERRALKPNTLPALHQRGTQQSCLHSDVNS